jgi:hypothetical protein
MFASFLGDCADDSPPRVGEPGSMATLAWLLAWLVAGAPDLAWFGSWNDWAVALLCCIVFDVFGGREVVARR